jgi:hypothetical protein
MDELADDWLESPEDAEAEAEYAEAEPDLRLEEDVPIKRVTTTWRSSYVKRRVPQPRRRKRGHAPRPGSNQRRRGSRAPSRAGRATGPETGTQSHQSRPRAPSMKPPLRAPGFTTSAARLMKF